MVITLALAFPPLQAVSWVRLETECPLVTDAIPLCLCDDFTHVAQLAEGRNVDIIPLYRQGTLPQTGKPVC